MTADVDSSATAGPPVGGPAGRSLLVVLEPPRDGLESFAMRRVAQRIYEEMSRVHPLLTKYMKLHEETWQGVEENHFAKV